MVAQSYEEVTPEEYRQIARSSYIYPNLDQFKAMEANWWFFGGMLPIAFEYEGEVMNIYLEDIASPYYDYLICKMNKDGSFDVVNLEEDIDNDDD